MIRFLLTLFFCVAVLPATASLRGNVEYSIPIDYAKLNRSELEEKAELHYRLGVAEYNSTINKDITDALYLYNILSKKCPNYSQYAIKLGRLYDLISHDRLAKSSYYRAIGIDKKNAEAYFYFGEFYYKRQQYRQALKCYKLAFENGYSEHYETVYKLGDIYQKLGDTKSALKYIKLASEINSNSNTTKLLKEIEASNKLNKEYYKIGI